MVPGRSSRIRPLPDPVLPWSWSRDMLRLEFAVSAGANVKAVQRMLGHSSAAMTLDSYADLFDDDLDAVADALDAVVSQLDVAKVLPRADVGGWRRPAIR
jgi:integrase